MRYLSIEIYRYEPKRWNRNIERTTYQTSSFFKRIMTDIIEIVPELNFQDQINSQTELEIEYVIGTSNSELDNNIDTRSREKNLDAELKDKDLPDFIKIMLNKEE